LIFLKQMAANMTYVKCAGCGEIIEIPDELSGDWEGDITDPENPRYCDACQWEEERYYPFEEMYP
jgi:hypothetical protein